MHSVLDRSDRQDVRLHQPRCDNASAVGLRGYVDNTLLPLVARLLHRLILVMRRIFLNFYYVPQQWYQSQVFYGLMLYARVEHK